MNMVKYISILFVGVFLISCSSNTSSNVSPKSDQNREASSSSTFSEASKNRSHATLKFEPHGPMGQTVHPLEINGKAPSQLKWTHKEFIIHPGKMSLLVKAFSEASFNVLTMVSLQFNAVENETYTILRKSKGIDSIEVIVVNSQGKKVTSAIGKKGHQPTPAYIPIYIPI